MYVSPSWNRVTVVEMAAHREGIELVREALADVDNAPAIPGMPSMEAE